MIYFLYGSDTYRSRKKLNEIIAAFREKNASRLNLHQWDAEEHDTALLKAALEVDSLFGSKKLVVCRSALSNEAATRCILDNISACADSKEMIVVLWEGELGAEEEQRRKKIEPYLTRSQEFKTLEGFALTRWIRDEARALGVALTPQDEMRLAAYGGNLWAIANELEKFSVSRGRAYIAPEADSETTIFEAGDTLFHSPERSIKSFLKILDRGHDAMNLFSYLVNRTRTLIIVDEFSHRARPVPKNFGIHPFVIKKATSLIRLISRTRLNALFRRFFEEDRRIKTGRSDPKESLLQVAVDFAARAAKNKK